MANKQLAESLRALADKVEQLPEHLRTEVQFTAYSVSTIENLKAMSSLMQEPKANKHTGTHWLNGYFSEGIRVTAFYVAGLLGKTRKRKVRVVEREAEETDLSVLTQ